MIKLAAPFAVIAIALYGLGSSLVPLLLSAIAALLCDPFIKWLNTKGIKKPYSTLLIIIGIFIPILIFNALLIPVLLREAKEFLTVLPGNMERLLDQIEKWTIQIGMSLRYDRSDIMALVNTHASQLSVNALTLLTDGLKKSAGNVTQVLITVLNIFLIPIFFFYVVTEKNYWQASMKALIPKAYHKQVSDSVKHSLTILKSYVQGQFLACFILSIIYALGLYLVGLKFGILIGLITGGLSFIPYVGFSMGLALGLIVAAAEGQGFSHIALVLLVFMIGQALESFVITPKLVGHTVGLTALESILTLIIFGNLFGFVGMLVAIPTGAIIKTTIAGYISKSA